MYSAVAFFDTLSSQHYFRQPILLNYICQKGANIITYQNPLKDKYDPLPAGTKSSKSLQIFSSMMKFNFRTAFLISYPKMQPLFIKKKLLPRTAKIKGIINVLVAPDTWYNNEV